MSQSALSRKAADYSNLRTLPAVLGIAFAVTSLYQFGGISVVHLAWADYTLTPEAATIGSLGIYLLAFASSETKQLENYEGWEMVFIGAAPVLIVAHQYTNYVADLVANNDPAAGIVCFGITMLAWGVAVR